MFRYLKKLKEHSIASSDGLSAMHGTRRRILHSEGLLSVPRESETPAFGESGTRSKSLDSKKVHGSRKKQHHPETQKTCDDAASYSHSPEPLPEQAKKRPESILLVGEGPKPDEAYEKRVDLFVAIARRNILRRTTESPEAVWMVLRILRERAARAGTIIRSPAYFETGFDAELAQDLERASKYANSAELISSMSANRHKIACLQLAVEEAARSERRAEDILAERLPGELYGKNPVAQGM